MTGVVNYPEMAKSVTLASGPSGISTGEHENSHKTVSLRTCVGCRKRSPKSRLVRLVSLGEPPRLGLDCASRLPGRGAWIHPKLSCFDMAQRKRSFARALRVSRLQETSQVREELVRWLG